MRVITTIKEAQDPLKKNKVQTSRKRQTHMRAAEPSFVTIDFLVAARACRNALFFFFSLFARTTLRSRV